jgi:hypothetical protein
MPITRTPIIDDATGKIGTVFENAWKQELYNQIDAFVGSGAALADQVERLTPTTLPGNVLTLSATKSIHLVACANTATMFLSATQGQAGRNGERLIICGSFTAGALLFVGHAAGGGSTSLLNFMTVGQTPLAAGGVAEYVFSGNAWVLIAHDQGQVISFVPTLSFGGAAVGMTYATRVASYLVKSNSVKISGRMTLSAKGSSVGGAVITGLPFAVHPTMYGYLGFQYFGGWVGLGSPGSPLLGYFTPNATQAAIMTPLNGATVSVTDANATAAADIVFDGMYLTQ